MRLRLVCSCAEIEKQQPNDWSVLYCFSYNYTRMYLVKIKGFTMLLVAFIAAFIVSMIMGVMLPLMIIAPRLYRRMTDQVIGMWFPLPVGLLETVFGTHFKAIGSKLLPNERSLIIMNHRTRLDWMFFVACLLRHTKVSNLKIVLKSQLRTAPALGWAMQVSCFIFLARQWAKDRVWLTSLLKYFNELQYQSQLLLFPEGINFCRTGRELSDAYAQKNNLPLYKYVLHPHTTGFSFLVDHLRQTKMIDTVYDVTVAYCDKVPEKGELDIYHGNVPKEMQFLVHRYPVDALPQNKEDLDNWCVEKWQEKENRLEKFYTGNRTFEGQVHGELEDLSSKGLIFTYGNILAWVLLLFTTVWSMWTFSLVRWAVAVIIAVYVIVGKYFVGFDHLAVASLNFTQDQAQRARVK